MGYCPKVNAPGWTTTPMFLNPALPWLARLDAYAACLGPQVPLGAPGIRLSAPLDPPQQEHDSCRSDGGRGAAYDAVPGGAGQN